MATFKAIVFKKHIKQDGTSNIKIRIYHNRESQYIATSYYIHPGAIDDAGRIMPHVENGEMIEYEINAYIQKIRKEYLKLGQDRTNYMSCMDLKEEIEKSLAPDAEFIDFVEFAQTVIQQTNKGKTAEWYQASIDTLCWYTKRKRIDIKQVNSLLLNKMIKDLYRSGPAGIPLEPGTISNYLRGLRALYNKAKLQYNNEDFDIIRIPGNPFKKVEIPEYRRKRKSIDPNTLLKIRDFHSDKRRTMMAKDVFMMMFYMMGININDLFSLSCERHGRIEYSRSKTDTEKNYDQILLSIKIEPELRVLLDKYTQGYFLSYFHTNYGNLKNFMRAVNIGLKDICNNLGLDFKITTNWARHSWASLARNKAGVPKADIDFCLGHVNNDYKMADIYIEIDYSICDKANRAVLDLLQKKGRKKRLKNL